MQPIMFETLKKATLARQICPSGYILCKHFVMDVNLASNAYYANELK